MAVHELKEILNSIMGKYLGLKKKLKVGQLKHFKWLYKADLIIKHHRIIVLHIKIINEPRNTKKLK